MLAFSRLPHRIPVLALSTPQVTLSMSLIRYFALGAVIQMLCVSSCSAPDSLTGRQGPNPVHAYARMDSLAEASIRERAFPGAAVAIGRGEDVHRIRGYGTYTYESGRRTTPQSLFDVASLTKVVATTTASMLLYEQGLLDLDATVRSYLPEFDAPDKSEVTLRHLLTHTSGFIPFRPFYEDGVITRRAVIDSIFTIPLESIPGEEYAYSDFGMITLALVIEAVTGRDFASYTAENVFHPLGVCAPEVYSVGKSRDLYLYTYFNHLAGHHGYYVSPVRSRPATPVPAQPRGMAAKRAPGLFCQ